MITGVNRSRVDDLQDLRERMRGLSRGAVLLQLRRDGEAYLARVD